MNQVQTPTTVEASTINIPPVDVPGIRAWRLACIRRQLAQHDYAGIVLFDPLNIRYATDCANMQVWTMHNAVRYAFVPTDGPVVLFDFHHCEHLSAGIETIAEVRPACGWSYFGAGPRVAELARRWAAELADLVIRYGGGNRRLALDNCNPQGVEALLGLGVSVHNGQEVMEQARKVKSSAEIDAMKSAIGVCEEGMRRMHQALAPGMSENELWSILHQTNIALGGEWIETRLLTSGPRTNPWFQECGHRVIDAGDLVSFDTDLIGPYGYCADISRTWYCGDGSPGDEHRALYAIAREQIAHNLQLVRPGATFREISEQCYQLPENCRYNRYSVVMHGVGLCDEYPAVYYPEDAEQFGYEGMLLENMVMCVESYVGRDGGREGVKLEEQVLVTRDGPVVLSTYPFEDSFL